MNEKTSPDPVTHVCMQVHSMHTPRSIPPGEEFLEQALGGLESIGIGRIHPNRRHPRLQGAKPCG